MSLLTILYYLFFAKMGAFGAYYGLHKWFTSTLATRAINGSGPVFNKVPSVKALLESERVTKIHIGTFPLWSPSTCFFTIVDAIFFKRWLYGYICLNKFTDNGAGVLNTVPLQLFIRFRGFRAGYTTAMNMHTVNDVSTYFKDLLKQLYVHVPVFINDYEYVGTLFDINKATMEESMATQQESPAEKLKRLREQRKTGAAVLSL